MTKSRYGQYLKYRDREDRLYFRITKINRNALTLDSSLTHYKLDLDLSNVKVASEYFENIIREVASFAISSDLYAISSQSFGGIFSTGITLISDSRNIP